MEQPVSSPMLTHWINELMNLLAGNSRYVHYGRLMQLIFVLLVLIFLAIPIVLMLIS